MGAGIPCTGCTGEQVCQRGVIYGSDAVHETGVNAQSQCGGVSYRLDQGCREATPQSGKGREEEDCVSEGAGADDQNTMQAVLRFSGCTGVSMAPRLRGRNEAVPPSECPPEESCSFQGRQERIPVSQVPGNHLCVPVFLIENAIQPKDL